MTSSEANLPTSAKILFAARKKARLAWSMERLNFIWRQDTFAKRLQSNLGRGAFDF